ncbi:MAG: DNA recombination protein RmuC [Acidobacteriota bacterium]
MLITVLVGALAFLLGWFVAHSRAQRAIGAAEARLAAVDQDKFLALAQRAFARVGESLVQMNKTQVDGTLGTKTAEIETMLTPVREMLDQYRGEVNKSERARVEAYGGLQEQIRSLLTAQESAQREASRLANALQSPTVRGSWGESSLKRCVELAGMSEFCDFDTQRTFATDEGRRVRPDLIVRLPNKRVIAVDAKVPLSEYTIAANETDEKRRADALDQHAKTVRRHIDSLSRREYHASIGETVDFVILFVPGEHFLSAALTTDPTLFDFAAQRRVYLASAAILLPLLRAVEAGWKAERTEENAKKMHDAGVELFNRFVKVMELFSDLGATLAKTVEKYNGVIRSIDSRLWPKGEEMQRMAGSGKELAAMTQIEAVPIESSKLRLTMQGEEPGELLPFRE